jgi:hypothetical protein
MKLSIAIVGLLLTLQLASDAHRAADAAEREPVLLVYVGADDCGPCQTWRHEHRPQFIASREFGLIRYREIVVPQLRDLLSGRDWPTDLAAVGTRVRERPGAPQWFLLRGERIVMWEGGLPAWRSRLWPAIRAEARSLHSPPEVRGH